MAFLQIVLNAGVNSEMNPAIDCGTRRQRYSASERWMTCPSMPYKPSEFYQPQQAR